MLSFESVETKSNEFRVAYSKLLSTIKGHMANDTAFANQVRQAIFESVFALSVTRALPVNGYLKPQHAHKLGRYQTPALFPYRCYAYVEPNSVEDIESRLFEIVQAVADTFGSLVYIATEEEPIRWFSGFSKCGFWESFSTAILGVSDEKVAEIDDAPFISSGVEGGSFRLEEVDLEPSSRGFAYPLLALTYLQKQLSSLEAGILIRSSSIIIPGIRDYTSLIGRFFALCQTSIDDTANMIMTLKED